MLDGACPAPCPTKDMDSQLKQGQGVLSFAACRGGALLSYSRKPSPSSALAERFSVYSDSCISLVYMPRHCQAGRSWITRLFSAGKNSKPARPVNSTTQHMPHAGSWKHTQAVWARICAPTRSHLCPHQGQHLRRRQQHLSCVEAFLVLGAALFRQQQHFVQPLVCLHNMVPMREHLDLELHGWLIVEGFGVDLLPT